MAEGHIWAGEVGQTVYLCPYCNLFFAQLPAYDKHMLGHETPETNLKKAKEFD